MNFELEIVSAPVNYDAVGRCIYCSATEHLSDEHIVPLSLGGNWVLPGASCPKCRDVTGKFELELARHFFWSLRAKMRFPSRKADWPAEFFVDFILEDDSEVRVKVPVARHPTELFLYKLGECALLSGQPFDPDTRFLRPWRNGPPSELVRAVLLPYEAEVTRLSGKRVVGVSPSRVALWPLCQALSKMAHAYAVAELGLFSFRPLVTPVILNNVRGGDPTNGIAIEAMQRYIGGSVERFEEHDEVLHQLALRVVQVEGKDYAVVDLWLFALLGGAKYHVVVGELNNEALRDAAPSRALLAALGKVSVAAVRS